MVMSNLFGFDGIHTADEVLNKLCSLAKEYLIDLERACVVERDKGGKVHIKQAVNLAGVGAAMDGMRVALGDFGRPSLSQSACPDGDRRNYRSRYQSLVRVADRLRHRR